MPKKCKFLEGLLILSEVGSLSFCMYCMSNIIHDGFVDTRVFSFTYLRLGFNNDAQEIDGLHVDDEVWLWPFRLLDRSHRN